MPGEAAYRHTASLCLKQHLWFILTENQSVFVDCAGCSEHLFLKEPMVSPTFFFPFFLSFYFVISVATEKAIKRDVCGVNNQSKASKEISPFPGTDVGIRHAISHWSECRAWWSLCLGWRALSGRRLEELHRALRQGHFLSTCPPFMSWFELQFLPFFLMFLPKINTFTASLPYSFCFISVLTFYFIPASIVG